MSSRGSKPWLTDYQTLHLVLAEHFNAKNFSHLVVVLIRTPSRRHNTQLTRPRAIEFLLLNLQLLHEVKT